MTSHADAASDAIAYRVNNLGGYQGLELWRWLIISEGIITCVSVVVVFSIADFPEEVRFMTPHERNFLKRRLEIVNGSASAFEIKNTIG